MRERHEPRDERPAAGPGRAALRRLGAAVAALALLGAASAADAACYADYKARKGPPLRLHYGVIQLPDRVCGKPKAAARVIARRIGADGWQLLAIVSFFGPEGLASRKASAGKFFLRY